VEAGVRDTSEQENEPDQERQHDQKGWQKSEGRERRLASALKSRLESLVEQLPRNDRRVQSEEQQVHSHCESVVRIRLRPGSLAIFRCFGRSWADLPFDLEI